MLLTKLTSFASGAYKDPLYLREHTKKHLQNAIHNDSKFLAELNIMDYSLIVGEDTASGELVVAIIGELDYQHVS